MADKNLLDDIFDRTEEETEVFADLLERQAEESLATRSTSSYTQQSQGFITIVHGNHEDNYVWHLKPHHPRKPWAVPLPRVIYAIAKVLNQHIPTDVLIDIFPPQQAWEIPEITVKAQHALDHWAVNLGLLDKVTGQLFEVLNKLV